MKLYSLTIKGFRRIAETEILFGDATFLIGENNSGKSTILKSIEYLLSVKKTIPSQEYYSVIDEDTGELGIYKGDCQIDEIRCSKCDKLYTEDNFKSINFG